MSNVASVDGPVGLPRQHPYVASKGGPVGLTQSLALDWVPDVRVNCIAPGYGATDLTDELRANDDPGVDRRADAAGAVRPPRRDRGPRRPPR
nr:SDR family NAD(P)-dependent oxidoreductase [Halomarina sp. PSR21]